MVGIVSDRNKAVTTTLYDVSSNQIKVANCDCGFKLNQPPHLSSQLPNGKKPRAKIQIITGSARPQNIGLHVNTNLHLKPKKRLGYNIVNVVLYCLLLSHVIWVTLELKWLRGELDYTKMQVDILTDSLESLNIQTMKLLESLVKGESAPEGGHSLQKRAVEPPNMSRSDCTNSTRQVRSVSRGKHSHSKNRNSCRRRCYRTSGPLAIHLKGALPEITVRDGGIIAPWYIEKSSSGVFLLEDGIVGEGRGIVEIVEEGLYFIYAQMYYLTSDALNSYAINLQLGEEGGRGMRRDMVVAVCSAEAASHKLSELSCYTAVVRYLRRGDRIFVTQRERNRKIIFRDNRSFLGLTLLNSPHGFPQ